MANTNIAMGTISTANTNGNEETTTIISVPSLPVNDIHNTRFTAIIRTHLGDLERRLNRLRVDVESIRRLIEQIKNLIMLYDKCSILPPIISAGTILSIALAIVLGFMVFLHPSFAKVYQIIFVVIPLSGLLVTAIWVIPCYWKNVSFDPLGDDRRELIVQVLVHLFLVVEFLRYLYIVLAASEAFPIPGIIDVILTWLCIIFTMASVISQRINDEDIIPSVNIYYDLQDSLVVLFSPFLLFVVVVFRNLISVMISHDSFRSAPIL